MDRDTQEWGEREKNAEGCREQLKQFTHLYVPKIKMLKAYPPKVMVLVGGFFEWWLGYEGKPSWVRLVPLENWPSRAPSTTRRYSEKDSYLLSGLSPDTKSAGVIVLDFPASRTVRHKWVLLISSTVYGISVRAAQADCCCSVSMVYLTATPWTAAHQASLSSTISRSLLKFIFIGSVTLSNHLILYQSLLFLPSIFPIIQVFSNESSLCIRWPKYGSFSLSISPSSEYSGLISLRINWVIHLYIHRIIKNHKHILYAMDCPRYWNITWTRSNPRP